MAGHWVSADLLTGREVGDLPGLETTSGSPVQRTVSNFDTASLTLYLDDQTPENWQRAILEGGSLLAVYDDQDPLQAIIWCGYVTSSVPDAGADAVPVSATTFEGVLDRAYVGDAAYDHTWHRDDIIADLVTTWFESETGIAYLQLQYTPGGGPTPVDDSMVFQNTDNATLKGRMDQVFAQLGGEYTVEWNWSTDRLSLIPTLIFGDRIGTAAMGANPAVTFSLPGSMVAFNQTKDYSAGNGANKVVAFSSGQGVDAPSTIVAVSPTQGRPTFTYRYQPAVSVSPAALTQYVGQAAKVLAPGSQPITFTATLVSCFSARRLGRDWFLGDDLGYAVPPTYINEQGQTVKVRAFPNGAVGVGRAIAYQLDLAALTVTPILADSVVYVVGN